MRAYACVLAILVFGIVPADAGTKVISGVPSYLWYYGCGPTALGMIVGYWDSHGFDRLIPGSNDWNGNQQALKAMIASPGHIRDYWPTPDRTPTAKDPYHADDCVADFLWASRDPLQAGQSFETDPAYAFTDFMKYRGYKGSSSQYLHYGFNGELWDNYVGSINVGRPVELYVDSDSDGRGDHFVAAFGYDDTPGNHKYACYNTWDQQVHWYAFDSISSGRSFGVGSGTLFTPAIPGDANADGKVDVSDLGILATNWQNSGNWGSGDFNGDGVVDVLDLGIMATNWQHTAAGAAVPGGDTIPEPATLVLVLGAGLWARRLSQLRRAKTRT